MQLIAEKKASILGQDTQKKVGRKDLVGHDLLTLLIKANMATDVPESQRLTDEEVLAREFNASILMYFYHGSDDETRGAHFHRRWA